MINIIKSGRLGNNLFQFAFGLAISKKLKTKFLFETDLIEVYFELGNYNNYLFKKFRKVMYLLSLKFNYWKSLNLDLNQSPSEIIELVENHSIIFGFFQSEDYFANIHKEIKRHFRVKNKYISDFKNKYKLNSTKEIICVAIRMTDYESWIIEELSNTTPALSFHYFEKVLRQISNLTEKQLIFVSDDLPAVKANFNFKNAIFVESEINSFIALTLSDTLIISNSSFHWWGAWLNEKPNKKVYAPNYWLGHKMKIEFPQYIIPKSWIKIDSN